MLGEAAGQLSNEVKARFPEVTWQQLPAQPQGPAPTSGRVASVTSCAYAAGKLK